MHSLNGGGDALILFVRRQADVAHDQKDVGVLEAVLRFAIERLAELMHRPMDSRRVNEDHLGCRQCQDAELPAARRLRAGRHSGHRLAEERIDKGRLAGIRSSGQGDVAGTEAGGGVVVIHPAILGGSPTPVKTPPGPTSIRPGAADRDVKGVFVHKRSLWTLSITAGLAILRSQKV